MARRMLIERALTQYIRRGGKYKRSRHTKKLHNRQRHTKKLHKRRKTR